MNQGLLALCPEAVGEGAKIGASVHLPAPLAPARMTACGMRWCRTLSRSRSTVPGLPRNSAKPIRMRLPESRGLPAPVGPGSYRTALALRRRAGAVSGATSTKRGVGGLFSRLTASQPAHSSPLNSNLGANSGAFKRTYAVLMAHFWMHSLLFAVCRSRGPF